MRSKSLMIPLILLMAVFISACSTAVAQEKEPATRTLSVTGNAQAFITPDIAHITIGVHTENKDASEAVAESNSKSKAVIDTIKAQGIAAADIRTNNFSIYPSYEFGPNGERRALTYIVENTVSVTIRDLTKIGDLLDAVVTSGANNINSIQFDVADKDEALSLARQEAVANARQMAEEMAAAAGVTLGEIQNISFYNNYPIPVMYDRAAQAEMAAAVPIEAGQLTVSVDVSVVYEIH